MDAQVYAEIGERLRERRRQMGMTQEEIASLLGISGTYYGEIERGNRQLSVPRILNIYDKMGLDPTFLLTGEKISGKMLTAAFQSCPKEKQPVLEQIFHCLTMLYR